MKYDLIFKNAQVVLPQDLDLGRRSKLKIESIDVAVTAGKISNLGIHLGQDAETIVDLKGLHLLPGVIDSQVHFREPGLTHKEDLESGTRGALLGGITTIFEMPNTTPSTTTLEAFEDKLTRAKGRCYTNYAFFIGGSPENILELNKLETHTHCSGVKVFMGSSTGNLLVDADAQLEKILAHTHRRVIFHCEDEFILKDRKPLFFPKSNNVSDHPHWRNEESALNATQRILNLARKLNRRVHILHVTTAEEMELLSKNKDLATVEVLPQHLTVHAPDCYEKWGTLAQQNPPIRSLRHQQALWKAVQSGIVDIVASDHAPHTLEEKRRIYPNTPSGMTGVQTLLPIMLNHVNNSKISLEHLVSMTTENVRDVFKMKNKGRIQIGMDADFSIVDLKRENTITNNWIASKSQWTIFDGMKVRGWPEMVYLNGQLAMSNGAIVGSPRGEGVFLQTTKPSPPQNPQSSQPPTSVSAPSKWSLLAGLLPILVYTVVEEIYGLYWGLICGLIIGVSEIVFEKLIYKKISLVTWIVNSMIIGLGVFSLYMNDGIWFKLQPAFAEGLMVILLWGSLAMGKPFLAELVKKQNPSTPENLITFFKSITFRLGFFFLIHTGLAVWSALTWSTTHWALLKGVGFTISFLVYLVIEMYFFMNNSKKKGT